MFLCEYVPVGQIAPCAKPATKVYVCKVGGGESHTFTCDEHYADVPIGQLVTIRDIDSDTCEHEFEEGRCEFCGIWDERDYMYDDIDAQLKAHDGF